VNSGTNDTAGRGRRTRAEQQAETRARLVEAAAEVFAAHGFEGASIDTITERAGYSRGAFYSNFSDKAELLLELSATRMRDFALTLPEIVAADRDEQVASAARWLIEQPPAPEVLLLVELARLRDDTDAVLPVLDELTTSTLRFVEEVLEAAPDQPTPATPEDRAALSQALLAGVFGLQLLRHVGLEVSPRTAELLLAGTLHSPVVDRETPEGGEG
jgi:AcrR family transcriptional regulator